MYPPSGSHVPFRADRCPVDLVRAVDDTLQPENVVVSTEESETHDRLRVSGIGVATI